MARTTKGRNEAGEEVDVEVTDPMDTVTTKNGVRGVIYAGSRQADNTRIIPDEGSPAMGGEAAPTPITET